MDRSALKPLAWEVGEECSLDDAVLLTAEHVSVLPNGTNTRNIGPVPPHALSAAPPVGFDGEIALETVSGSWNSAWGSASGALLAQGTHASFPSKVVQQVPSHVPTARAQLAEAIGADPPHNLHVYGESARGYNHRDALCAEHLASLNRVLPCRSTAGLLAHLIALPDALLADAKYAAVSVASSRNVEEVTFRVSMTAVLPEEYLNTSAASLLQSATECPLAPFRGQIREQKLQSLQRTRCALPTAWMFASRYFRHFRHARGAIQMQLAPYASPLVHDGANVHIMQPLPWFIRPLRRSVQAWSRLSDGSNTSKAPLQLLQMFPSKLHSYDGTLSAWLQLPPNASEVHFELEYEAGLVHAEEMPPDYGRGLHIPPLTLLSSPIGSTPNISTLKSGRSCAFVVDSEHAIVPAGFYMQQSAPGLAHIMMPDPAMRFNAATLVSAIVASFVSGYLTIVTARRHYAKKQSLLSRIRSRLSQLKNDLLKTSRKRQ